MRIHLLIGPTAESSDRFRTILKKKNALLAKSVRIPALVLESVSVDKLSAIV